MEAQPVQLGDGDAVAALQRNERVARLDDALLQDAEVAAGAAGLAHPHGQPRQTVAPRELEAGGAGLGDLHHRLADREARADLEL